MALQVVALVLAPACVATSEQFAFVDEAQPAPVAVGPALRDDGSNVKAQASAPDPSACGRGTGRTASGECVTLALRMKDHAQQVQIPAGELWQGYVGDDYDVDRFRSSAAVRFPHQPVRRVPVPSFWIDVHEVTRAAYAKCVEAGACTPAVCPAGAADPAEGKSELTAAALPQTCVSHPQATAFCAHHGLRLPRESEWEYAARGTDGRKYPWGDGLRDEYTQEVLPVGALRSDASYFGVLGMGTSGFEWVADSYEPDGHLRPWLAGEFRRSDGPLATARQMFARSLACDEGEGASCRAGAVEPPRAVVKGGSAGLRTAALMELPPRQLPVALEGWRVHTPDPALGFRCAAALDPAVDAPLTVPTPATPTSLVRVMATAAPAVQGSAGEAAGPGSTGAVAIWAGVFEAVAKDEAVRACEQLRVGADGAPPGPDAREGTTGWRLPTTAEVIAIADAFRGPGPFWTADGAVARPFFAGSDRRNELGGPYEPIEARPDEPLLARCVRDAASSPP